MTSTCGIWLWIERASAIIDFGSIDFGSNDPWTEFGTESVFGFAADWHGAFLGAGDGHKRSPKGIDEAVEEVQQGYWPTTSRALPPPFPNGLSDFDRWAEVEFMVWACRARVLLLERTALLNETNCPVARFGINRTFYYLFARGEQV